MSEWAKVTCYLRSCQIDFALPKVIDNQLRRNGQDFFCPNGHRQAYILGPTAEEKLRQENARLADEARRAQESADYHREQRQAADRRASAARGQVTKIKNRVGHGVCPCCNRTFADLARHMAGQHPDFQKGEADG